MTSRTLLSAANWKMHKTSAEGRALAAEICARVPHVQGCEVVLCPPFTALAAVLDAVGTHARVSVGGQNCFWERQGAYTGEISAEMLAELGCRYVIIGHSERRQYFGESDATVAKRARSALDAGLLCIVCVGETEVEREAGNTEAVLSRQMQGGLGAFREDDWPRLILAYEPVWAIGTGRTATPEMANDAHTFLRGWVAEHVSSATADGTRILYGGSVKPENAADLFAQPEIDGGLIGGASLKADRFLAITEALASTSTRTL